MARTEAPAGDRPRVMLVGAYERDNVGDLLFLLQTERYLRQAAVTAAAPFPGDMTRLLDRAIPAYGPLLASERYDAIWTVGGEVGSTSVLGALRMSMPPGFVRAYDAAAPADRQAMLERVHGTAPMESPYVPRPTAYPANATAASVLHSVGLAGVTGLPPDEQARRLEVLREADRISVRDRLSSELLAAHGIAHRLAPDLVHTLALTRPVQHHPREADTVLVQISAAHLRTLGVEAFAEALARSTRLAPYRIRLFLAGSAPGHDSVGSYERLADLVRARRPDRDIAISPERRPYDRVDAIAAARLWIGLSLHGRIVAAAYGVPRISLAKRKLNAYAQTWDPDMPYGVTPEILDDAVAEALSPAVAARSADVGEDLARTADAEIRQAVAETLGPSLSDPAVLVSRAARRITALEALRHDEVARARNRAAEGDGAALVPQRPLERLAALPRPATGRLLTSGLRRVRAGRRRHRQR